MPSEIVLDAGLLADLRGLIVQARQRVAVAVNRELVMLYWDLGQRIRVEILKEERAGYGEQIVSTLSTQLTAEFGNGFGKRVLFRMIQFAELFPDRALVEKLSEVLSWSHFVELLPLRDPLAREFYATMCHACRWSVRGLHREIAGALFLRTALSRNTDELVRRELAALRDEDQWTPDLVFRDPYLLSFLGLADTFDEKDLEDALLREMERFLLELGAGFAFVARQKRITVDGRDFYLDLLFYHRGLRRLVALDLKIGAFEPGFKGQMELYLRWLDKHERAAGEEAPIGLILCAEAGAEQLELLQIGQHDIHVAEYVTRHLPPALLHQKLQEARRRGLDQIAARQQGQSESEEGGQ
jgi:predicted nuclease of restriction endonuclease-like (RecB) superfamily